MVEVWAKNTYLSNAFDDQSPLAFTIIGSIPALIAKVVPPRRREWALNLVESYPALFKRPFKRLEKVGCDNTMRSAGVTYEKMGSVDLIGDA